MLRKMSPIIDLCTATTLGIVSRYVGLAFLMSKQGSYGVLVVNGADKASVKGFFLALSKFSTRVHFVLTYSSRKL